MNCSNKVEATTKAGLRHLSTPTYLRQVAIAKQQVDDSTVC